MAQVQQLLDMGFPEAEARRALLQTNDDVQQAIERLLTGIGGGEPEPQPLRLGDPGQDSFFRTRPEDRDGPPASQTLLPAGALRGVEGSGDFAVGGSHGSVPPPPTLKDAEDLDFNTALEMSMREQQEGLAPAPEGARRQYLPCGLLNIGNTCYVNSLLQTLLHIDEFREQMLRYRTPAELGRPAGSAATAGGSGEADAEPEAEDGGAGAGSGGSGAPPKAAEEGARPDASREERIAHGTRLASELRRLFAYSLFTARSCIDPSRLLRELVDQRGQKLPIGSQEDVGEFMLKFVEQLDEGLRNGDFIAPPTAPEAPPAADPAAASPLPSEGEPTPSTGEVSLAQPAAGAGAGSTGAAPAPAPAAADGAVPEEPAASQTGVQDGVEVARPGAAEAVPAATPTSAPVAAGGQEPVPPSPTSATQPGQQVEAEAAPSPVAAVGEPDRGAAGGGAPQPLEPGQGGDAATAPGPAAPGGAAPAPSDVPAVAEPPAGGAGGESPPVANSSGGDAAEAVRARAGSSGPGPASTDPGKAAAGEAKAAGGTDAAEGRTGDGLSLLQTLFLGEQVQVLSYREGRADAAADAEGGRPEGSPRVMVAGGAEEGGEAAKTSEAKAADKAPPESDAVKAPVEAAAGGQNPPTEATEHAGLVVSQEKSEFLQIFLDVKYKNLYTAWEAATRTEVDYTTPRGSNTQATTSTWIKRLPKFLFFQLQRVAFDQERKAQVKLDDSFDFDPTVYVDRFLLPNRDEATRVAAKVRDLQQRREEIADALRSFEDFRNRPGLGIDEVLDWAAECIEQNAENLDTGPTPSADLATASSAQIPRPHTAIALRPPGDKAEADLAEELRRSAPAAAELLRSIRKACLARAGSLRDDLNRLDAEIGSAYGTLRSRAFELYAIWVHSGIAGSGHYLAYLRDWQQDRWYRLDDALASVVAWEDVRTAAVGQVGSNTSAYVLVYVEAEVAAEQRKPREHASLLQAAKAVVPQELLQEICHDNEVLRQEQAERELRMAEQELRRHAEAIFQAYAGLLHNWEPLKRTGDTAGDPHDTSARKSLHDAALLRFELFLYRLYGEHDVWTSYLMQAVDAQRQIRQWREEDEGRVLYFLAQTLRSHKRYSMMLREKPPAEGGAKQAPQCELIPLDMTKLTVQYNVVLVQAHIIDEALQLLRENRAELVRTIGMLAFVWAKWNLEMQDRFRQNEVLLIMSTLIYNTVNAIERIKQSHGQDQILVFQPACEYFLLLLYAVEWPKSWKNPLLERLQRIYPLAASTIPGRATSTGRTFDGGSPGAHPVDLKEAVARHALTQQPANWDQLEEQRPEPGQEFFERHRQLYAWVMSSDESIAQDYVCSQSGLAAGVNSEDSTTRWITS